MTQVQTIRNFDNTSPWTVAFPVSVGPVGYSTYFVEIGANIDAVDEAIESDDVSVTPAAAASVSISNGLVNLTFDTSSGHLLSFTNLASYATLNLDQRLMFYNSSVGDTDFGTQKSGAYIFRPEEETPFELMDGVATLSMTVGPYVSRVVQTWADWAVQIYTLYASMCCGARSLLLAVQRNLNATGNTVCLIDHRCELR